MNADGKTGKTEGGEQADPSPTSAKGAAGVRDDNAQASERVKKAGDARLMAQQVPSICAGPSMLCP